MLSDYTLTTEAGEKKDVGEKIRLCREAQKLSQDDLANLMGSSRKMVSRHENGEQEMGIVTFFQYCDALNVTPDVLIPDRFKQQKEDGQSGELSEIIKNLSDEDIAILLPMVKRMVKM